VVRRFASSGGEKSHKITPSTSTAQNPRVTEGDAQKVVAIISSDKAKTQTYCKIQKLNEQVEQAYEKNSKMADELSPWLGVRGSK
jgi:hypothetical protein